MTGLPVAVSIATQTCLLLALCLLGTPSQASSLCDTGKQQSPIDIRDTQRRPLPALAFAYQPAPLKIANDGHTARVRLPTGSTLKVGQQVYRLQQLHFHTPGGDQIQGEDFPMAVHLLHKSAAGQLLAVVVVVRTGTENAALASLLPHVPASAGGDQLHPAVKVDPSQFLPSTTGYYRYPGSLTSAPCTEGVDWIVLKTPIEVSAAQLARYRQTFADNARPVQPRHQRTVLESQ
jgi:carbonic anhydrase